MKRQLALGLALAFVATVVVLTAADVDARRIGGGRSLGAQRTPPATTIAKPAAPAGSTAPGPAADPVMPRTAATPGATAAAPIAAPVRAGSRWLAPLAGIAAGLGLAALMSHFGLSESFGSLLVLLLLVGGAIWLVRMFIARRVAASPEGTPAYPGGYAGAREAQIPIADSAMAAPFGAASPRPLDSYATSVPAANTWPEGFDASAFARQALVQFRDLQAAYDRGDMEALAAVMTPELHAELALQRAEGGLAGMHAGSVFPTLAADVVDVTTEGAEHRASVRFQGSVREDGALVAEPFDEQWNLVKPVDDSSGWLVAGIQQTLATP